MTTNKRMVDLDALQKILKKHYPLHGKTLRFLFIEEIEALPSIHNPIDTTQVSRVEVIDEHGRAWTTYKAENVKIDFQDNERTLKIFLKSNKKSLQI